MNDTQIKHFFLQKLKQMLRTWHSYIYIASHLCQNGGSYFLAVTFVTIISSKQVEV